MPGERLFRGSQYGTPKEDYYWLARVWCRSKWDFSDIGALLRVAAHALRSGKETAPESLAGAPPALLF
jgi:hypothetical protein